jgi:hypothetical protein
MSAPRKPTRPREPSEQEVRNEEVLRANKELAAYFKGRRTEREARAALKIIKAYIRDRERADPASRSALPGAAVYTSSRGPIRKNAGPRKAPTRSVPRKVVKIGPPQEAAPERDNGT